MTRSIRPNVDDESLEHSTNVDDVSWEHSYDQSLMDSVVVKFHLGAASLFAVDVGSEYHGTLVG